MSEDIRTAPIVIDFGMAGDIEIDAIVKMVPGEQGSWEHGRQVSPTFQDGWNMVEFQHPQAPVRDFVTLLFIRDNDFATKVVELINTEVFG